MKEGGVARVRRRQPRRKAELVSLQEVLLSMAAYLYGRLGADTPFDPLPITAEQQHGVEEAVVLLSGPLLPRPRDRVRLPELLPRRRRHRSGRPIAGHAANSPLLLRRQQQQQHVLITVPWDRVVELVQ